MNTIKKILGAVWIFIALASVYLLLQTAGIEIAKKPLIDTKIQWGVFVGVSIPIAVGFIIFGYYALKGEYDRIE